MASSSIKQVRARNKHVGVLVFWNTNSLRIPLERLQNASYGTGIIILNPHVNLFAACVGDDNNNHRMRYLTDSENLLTATIDGTDLLINANNTLWGCTLVTVMANYDLSWGG